MRTLNLLVFSASLMWSQAQRPPESPPVPEQKGAESTTHKEKTDEHRQGPDNAAPIPEENYTKPLSKETPANPKEEDKLETDRKLADYTGKLATFTKLLVVVGILQFLALIAQGIVFMRTLLENRRLIEASQATASASGPHRESRQGREYCRNKVVRVHAEVHGNCPPVADTYTAPETHDSGSHS